MKVGYRPTQRKTWLPSWARLEGMSALGSGAVVKGKKWGGLLLRHNRVTASPVTTSVGPIGDHQHRAAIVHSSQETQSSPSRHSIRCDRMSAYFSLHNLTFAHAVSPQSNYDDELRITSQVKLPCLCNAILLFRKALDLQMSKRSAFLIRRSWNHSLQ